MDEAVASVATPAFDSRQVHRIAYKEEGQYRRQVEHSTGDAQLLRPQPKKTAFSERQCVRYAMGLLTEIDCDVEETGDIHGCCGPRYGTRKNQMPRLKSRCQWLPQRKAVVDKGWGQKWPLPNSKGEHMTKLDALKKLASAYHHCDERYRYGTCYGDQDAALILEDLFGRVRRSLRIEDLAPSKEGYNGKGPRFF